MNNSSNINDDNDGDKRDSRAGPADSSPLELCAAEWKTPSPVFICRHCTDVDNYF